MFKKKSSSFSIHLYISGRVENNLCKTHEKLSLEWFGVVIEPAEMFTAFVTRGKIFFMRNFITCPFMLAGSVRV